MLSSSIDIESRSCLKNLIKNDIARDILWSFAKMVRSVKLGVNLYE